MVISPPVRGDTTPRKNTKKAYRLMESAEDQLKERLSPEEWALFTQYQDAESKAGDIEDTDIFIEGFRMGAMIVMDVLLKAA
jgi:hypothetical protein